MSLDAKVSQSLNNSLEAAQPAQSLLKRLDWPLLGVLGLALLVRLYAWWQAPRAGFVIDEAEYYQIASMLADGRGWAFYDSATWVRPPLYVLLLGGSLWLGGYNLLFIRLIQVGLSVASVYLLYRLGTRAYGRRVGLIAGLLAAVAWPFAVLSYLLLSETLFLFLLLVAVNFLTEYVEEVESRKSNPPGNPPGRARSGAKSVPGFKFQVSSSKQLKTQNSSPIPHPSSLILAGFFLGLAALTRGQVLSFVPFVGVWLVIALGWRRWRQGLLAFGLLAIVFGLTLLPWAGRNFVAYGRPLIDTTGGYNFYLGALKGRDEERVTSELMKVANPAEREGLGYRRGLEILQQDPLAFIQKGFKELGDFWALNFGAEERLEDSYSKGAISPAWLLPGFVLGDVFYLLATGLALLGLLRASPLPGATSSGLRSFVLIWLSYNLMLAFGFFAVSRFRLPVYFFLLLFAAYVLAQLWEKSKVESRKHLKSKITSTLTGENHPSPYGEKSKIALLALPLLFWLLVWPSFAPQETWRGIEEWAMQGQVLRGDELRRQGRYDEALAAYAQGSPGNQTTQVGIGLTQALQGQYEAAIRRIEGSTPDSPSLHLALGWIYRRQGNTEYASSEFRTRRIALEANTDRWAWQHLPTEPLPNNRLTIGEFDWGYVEGFHFFEKEVEKVGKEGNRASAPYFRWTAGRDEDGQARSRLHFPLTPGAAARQLTLRVKGYRPPGLPSPTLQVGVNGRRLGGVQTTNEWQTFTLPLPADLTASREIIIELLPSSTFVPGGHSRRELGVMLEWASLE